MVCFKKKYTSQRYIGNFKIYSMVNFTMVWV